MFSTFVLFSVLAALVSAAPMPRPDAKSTKLSSRFLTHDPLAYNDIPCWEGGHEGVLQEAVCVLADIEVDGSQWQDDHYYVDGTPCWQDGQFGEIQDALCVVADVDISKRQFYPTSFVNGQKCWLDGREGYWRDTVCILADLDLDLKARGAYPVPVLLDGQQCWLNGQEGYWKNAICVLLAADVNVGLKKRLFGHSPAILDGTPCYRDGHNGFWHDNLCVLADVNVNLRKRSLGPEPRLLEGDKCWSKGRQGLFHNGLCIVADVDVNLKRSLLSEPFLHQGEPRWKDGHEGFYDNAICILADVTVEKRNLLGLGHREGDKCLKDGRTGFIQDTICVAAEIKVHKRLLGNGIEGGLLGNLLEPAGSSYGDEYRYNKGGDLNLIAEVTGDLGRQYKRNDLLEHVTDSNEAGGVVKGADHLLGHVETRDLLGLGGNGQGKDGIIADVAAAVDVNREYGDRRVFGDIVPGRGVGFVKRNLGGLDNLNDLGVGQAGIGVTGNLDTLTGGSNALGVSLLFTMVGALTGIAAVI